MLPIIDIVHTAINAGKDLSSLNIGNKGLSSLNRVVTAGLPKLTLSQNLWEQGNQFIVTHVTQGQLFCVKFLIH
jgi:hypothetical protein